MLALPALLQSLASWRMLHPLNGMMPLAWHGVQHMALETSIIFIAICA
jgi:hypothetical protein